MSREVPGARARVEPGPDAEHGRDAVRRDGIEQQFVKEAAADADSETHPLQAGEGACDRHTALSGQLRGEGIADQPVGAFRLHGAAGGGHQRRVADVCNLMRLGLR